MSQLSHRDISTLVDLLLACPSIQDKDIRNDVLGFLHDEPRHAIQRRDQDRADVVNIVKTCNNYPGELELLIECVQCYDNGSHPFQNLEQFWKQCQQKETSDVSTVEDEISIVPTIEDKNSIYTRVQNALSKTDFRRTVRQFEEFVDRFNDRADAALCLLQKGFEMGANLVIERMYQVLDINRKQVIDIRLGGGVQRGVQGILQKLAEKYHVKKSSSHIDQEEWAKEIIETICRSLHTGKILFMKITDWDNIECQDTMLCEFVERFWVMLLQEIHRIQQREPECATEFDVCDVRIIVVLITDKEISPLAIDMLSQKIGQNAMLVLDIEHWSASDIRKCIASLYALPGSEIDKLARSIHDTCYCGKPGHVHQWLSSRFNMYPVKR